MLSSCRVCHIILGSCYRLLMIVGYEGLSGLRQKRAARGRRGHLGGASCVEPPNGVCDGVRVRQVVNLCTCSSPQCRCAVYKNIHKAQQRMAVKKDNGRELNKRQNRMEKHCFFQAHEGPQLKGKNGTGRPRRRQDMSQN